VKGYRRAWWVVPLVLALVGQVRGERLRLPDLPVLTQAGTRLAFRSQAIGDRLVVVSAVYTGCSTVCPLTIAIFQVLQARLGARVGNGVRLLTVTLDPEHDTPARLAEAAREAEAGPSWLWLTGRKPDLDRILYAMGAYSDDFTEHPPFVLVGDGRRGVWRRLFGFPSPEELEAVLLELEQDRGAGDR